MKRNLDFYDKVIGFTIAMSMGGAMTGAGLSHPSTDMTWPAVGMIGGAIFGLFMCIKFKLFEDK